jgi:hypothetical protein
MAPLVFEAFVLFFSSSRQYFSWDTSVLITVTRGLFCLFSFTSVLALTVALALAVGYWLLALE